MGELSPPAAETCARIGWPHVGTWPKYTREPSVTMPLFDKPSCVICVCPITLGGGIGHNHAARPRPTAPAVAKSQTLPFPVAFFGATGVIVPDVAPIRRRSTAISLAVW